MGDTQELAAEKLQEEGLKIDHETLRWLIQKGLWTLGGRKRKQHRAWSVPGVGNVSNGGCEMSQSVE